MFIIFQIPQQITKEVCDGQELETGAGGGGYSPEDVAKVFQQAQEPQTVPQGGVPPSAGVPPPAGVPPQPLAGIKPRDGAEPVPAEQAEETNPDAVAFPTD